MRRTATLLSLVILVAAPACLRAQPAAADPATSFRMKALLDAGAWARARALGRAYLDADTTLSAERCRVLEGVAYADLMAARRDSAASALAAFDVSCRDVPLDRAVRGEAARIRRALQAPADSLARRPDED
jgi:hypothetical protein